MMRCSSASSFKFVKREIDTAVLVGEKIKHERRYIIGCDYSGIIIPHPITDYIDKMYYLKSGSINSEKSAADTLVQFLNYILLAKNEEQEEFLKVRGISDLQLNHLENFLAYCGDKGNKRGTVKRKEYYLIQFFYFIGIEKKKLNTIPQINLTTLKESHSVNWRRGSKLLKANLYYKQPSKSIFPNQIKKKDLVTQKWNSDNERKKYRLQTIREILTLASNNFPDVAFAVCLQIFGGLRSAECMNLSINAIKPQNNSQYGEKGLVIEIRDRQEILFKKRSLVSNDQVKKERDQAILLDPIVPYLYKKHLEWLVLKKKESRNNIQELPGDLALFLNGKAEPMKTHTYRSKFNNLKKLYLNLLASTEGRYEDFKEYRNTNWSTHICRGAFTNLCLDTGFTTTQTAVMRGDSSPDAMNAYTDILSASRKITQTINLLLTEDLPGEVNEENFEDQKKWREIMRSNENK